MVRSYRQIIERCQAALEAKYDCRGECQACRYLVAERKLIEAHGFETALVQATEFADDLNRMGQRGHLVGSGCSSIATFLLGLSEVDPLEYGTHISRFWLTGDGRRPVFQFVVESEDGHADDMAAPDGVVVHPMTDLERIPALLEKHLPSVDIARADWATFDAINAGETDSIFQFDTEPIRNLIARFRPTRIKDLAAITALNVIGCSQPEVVEAFPCLSAERDLAKHRRKADQLSERRPIIFQETILTLLRRETGLSWDDSGRFLREAAKGNMNGDHPLWAPAIEGAATRYTRDHGAARSLLNSLTEASKWAVCRAHHAANAITSYRAAYYRTHYQADFETAMKQVATLS